jgi:hypothetical protein
MFRYLLVLIVAVVIYLAQHPQVLDLSLSGPSFKVWVDQPFSEGQGASAETSCF